MRWIANCALIATAAWVGIFPVDAQSGNPEFTSPIEMLADVQATNGLFGNNLRPWHLTATYEIYDGTNKVTAAGMFDEVWFGHYQWRRSYTGSHYTGTEYSTSAGFAYQGDPSLAYDGEGGRANDALEGMHTPWPEVFIAEKLLYPVNIPYLSNLGRSLHPSAHFLESSNSDDPNSLLCVDPKEERFPLKEHYCFTRNGDELRESLLHFVNTKYIRTQRFQDRTIGVETEISMNGHLLLKVHVTSIEELPKAGGIAVPSGALKESPALESAGSVAKISASSRAYPVSAKEKNIEGVVVLAGLVKADGDLDSLTVVESPDQLLSNAALSRARNWHFSRPCLQDGEPVPCQFSTMFNFELSK